MTTAENHKNPEATTDLVELIESLRIKRMKPRGDVGASGTWVIGTIGGHKFEALVFPEHAECEAYELGDSRISKLHLRRLDDKREVACFDRGWASRPKDELANEIVGLLCDWLADHVFGG